MTGSLPALRSCRNWFALLVLPALLLRALIPVGFMPMVSAGGGISIEICPGVSDLPAGAWTAGRKGGGTLAAAGAVAGHAAHAGYAAQVGHGAHAGHEHQHGAGQDPSSPAHHAPCLFAASAGGAPAPSVFELASPAATIAVADLAEARNLILPTILRAQTSRGPPALS